MGLLNPPSAEHHRRDPLRGPRSAEAHARRAAQGARQRRLDDLPGSVRLPAPDVPRRRPDRRGRARAREGLEEAGLRARRSSCSARSGSRTPRARARDYPHQFSGGMRQRAMIAMALVHNPDVLIADEPTTALDVTVQAQILELIDRVKRDFDVGVILITHDLGVVAETASHVMVMYAGRVDGVRRPRRRSSTARSTRTPGACSSRCRRSSAGSTRCCRSRARRRRCSTRRPAARSTRAASTASSPATRSAPPLEACPAATSTRACLSPERSARSGGTASSARSGRRLSAAATAEARAGRRPARRGRAPDEALRGPAGRVRARQGRRARGRGRLADGQPRRDARDRRRVGLRQVDDRAADACGCSMPTAGTVRFDGQDITQLSHAAAAAAAPADADDLPGPVLVAQPAQDGRPDRRRAVHDPQDRKGRPRRGCRSCWSASG